MLGPEIEVAARRFFQEVWNDGDLSKVADFLAGSFVSHNGLGVGISGPAQYGLAVAAYRRAFPDLVVTLEDVFASRDRVAVRGTDRGTHQGEFMGRPGTGRKVTSTWIEIFRIEEGRAVEGWLETDWTALLDQLADNPVAD